MLPIVSRMKYALQKFAASKRNLYMTAGGLVIFFLVLMLAFSGDDEKESTRVIKTFINTAMTKYDPQEGTRFTAGVARQLVEKDMPKIQTAKAKGFKSELRGDTVVVPIEKKSGYIKSNVLIFTVEQKPGEPEKEFAHLWEISTQKVGGNWRIAKAETTYTKQVAGPGASTIAVQTAPVQPVQATAKQTPAPAAANSQATQPAKPAPAGQVQSPVPGIPLAMPQVQGR